MDVQLVLDEIDDLTIECSLQTIQSLAFITGYGVHKYMKRTLPCHVCIDLLKIDRTLSLMIFTTRVQAFTINRLRWSEYPSEFILESTIVTLWKRLIAIENKELDGDIDARIIQKDSCGSNLDILRKD